jgi:hypothetical protein
MDKGHIPIGERVLQSEDLHAIVERKNLVEAVKMKERDDLVTEGCGKVRSNFEGPVVPGQRLFVPAQPPQRKAKVIASVGVARIELIGFPAFGQGLVPPFQVVERPRTSLPGWGVTWRRRVSAIEKGKRLLVPPELVQESPAFRQGVLMMRVELQGFIEYLERVLVSSLLLQRCPEAHQVFRVGIEPDRTGEPLGRVVVLFGVQGQ